MLSYQLEQVCGVDSPAACCLHLEANIVLLFDRFDAGLN